MSTVGNVGGGGLNGDGTKTNRGWGRWVLKVVGFDFRMDNYYGFLFLILFYLNNYLYLLFSFNNYLLF